MMIDLGINISLKLSEARFSGLVQNPCDSPQSIAYHRYNQKRAVHSTIDESVCTIKYLIYACPNYVCSRVRVAVALQIPPTINGTDAG